jgi:16S rRNA (guanine(966)-N(2))-methyltransferase RsmD
VRIIGGKYKGRDLTSPSDFRVRPTAEKVRGFLLDQLKPDLSGARVLDLFAGTGALGLEAISRGAKYADFVETRPSSLHALKANIALLRLSAKCRVYKKDAVQFAEALTEQRWDIAFADPPYNSKMLDRVLTAWQTTKYAKLLAVEYATGHVLPSPDYRHTIEDTTIAIYRS